MFWVRLRSGIILVILALVTMFAGGKILLATMIFLSVIAYWELCGATGVRGKEGSGCRETKAGRSKRKMEEERAGDCGSSWYHSLLYIALGE